AHPRIGTDRTRTDACSPPGRGWGWVGSWKASFRSCACTGTMNPPLTPPRSGTDRTRTDACSPPGRGRGWVGSWRGSLRRNMDMAVRFNNNFMDAVRNGGEGRPASRPKDLNSSGDLRSSHHLHRAVLRPITRTGMDFLHWPGSMSEKGANLRAHAGGVAVRSLEPNAQ